MGKKLFSPLAVYNFYFFREENLYGGVIQSILELKSSPLYPDFIYGWLQRLGLVTLVYLVDDGALDQSLMMTGRSARKKLKLCRLKKNKQSRIKNPTRDLITRHPRAAFQSDATGD